MFELPLGLIPLSGWALIRFAGVGIHNRAFVAVVCLVALGASAWMPGLEVLSRFSMVLYSALCAATAIAAPKRFSTPGDGCDILLLLAGALTVYSSDNLLLLLGGWILNLVPLWRWFPGHARIAHSAGVLSLALAVGWMSWNARQAGIALPFDLNSVKGAPSIDSVLPFALICIAAWQRQALLPLQSWLPALNETGPLPKTMLFIHAQLGVFLLVRVGGALTPATLRLAAEALSDLALVTAAYVSIVALAEREARRVIALVTICQSSFVLGGLLSGTATGIAGGMAFWVVLVISGTMTGMVVCALEVRLGARSALDEFHGLAVRAPRLAVFFAAGALAIAGLPGTLGFCAEDLLMQGTLESRPWLGAILPLATALNAFVLVRTFAHLFLGRRERDVPPIPDALPRERWVLTAALVLIALLGLWPDLLLKRLA